MRFKGTVQKGGGTGTRQGFPTANIPLEDSSVSGIYAALVYIGLEEYHAAAYGDQKRKLLEVYLLHWHDELYGKEIEIELITKIREDRIFNDEADAKATIGADVEAVEAYFRSVN